MWIQHKVGDKKCSECCCGTKPCKCGGIIHCEVVDEWYTDDDWGWIHATWCDKCHKEVNPIADDIGE